MIAAPWARRLAFALVAATQGAWLPALAQSNRAQRPQVTTSASPVLIDVETVVTIAPDRSSLTRHTARIAIRTEAGARSASQQHVAHSSDGETLEVTQAYTQKADGRRLPVDPASIVTRDADTDAGAASSRDAKTTTISFPDVAAGDTLLLTTVRRSLQTAFEGHFVHVSVFSRSQPWGKVLQEFVAPKDIVLNIGMRGSAVVYTSEPAGDLVRHRFTFAGSGAIAADEPGATASIDREPGFAISTFDSYEEFGAHYWRLAASQIAVSDEIRALAEELTFGLPDKRAEAEAIDRWMKRYVRHVAADLGRQRWNPRTAAQVLARRAGDSRDQAVLMMALLEARQIRVQLALVNRGNSYVLSRYPPGHFNHAILRLPELDMYADPTASFSAFGVLGQEIYDKPVLLVSETGARLARVPPLASEQHSLLTRTRIEIGQTGSVSGSTAQTATGIFAAALRATGLRIQATGLETAAEAVLKAQKTPGVGKFEVTSPSELRDPYGLSSTFAWTDKLAVPLRGNRRTPYGLPLHSRPGTLLLGPRLDARTEPFVCLAGRQIEEIEIEFAAELPLPRRPPPRTLDTRLFKYVSTTSIDGRTLKIKREFRSTVPGQVCDPETAEELAEDLDSVLTNVGLMLSFGAQ